MSDVETVIEAQNRKERKAQAKRIATLKRENAELQELLLKQRELTGSFITSSAIIASENQRLRAHIQEAADRAGGALPWPNIGLRDHYLAALQPKEPNND